VFKSGAVHTCYTYKALQTIAEAYNKTVTPSQKIAIPASKTSSSKKALWHNIKEKMDKITNCEGEWCWKSQPFMKNVQDPELKELTFKPPIPKGVHDWLSTDDIDNVIKQYNAQHPELYFLGTWPIDFESLNPKFKTFDPVKLQKEGKTKVALVLNEDRSNQPGSHWTGLFMDLTRRQAQFFDSYGKPPLAPLRNWIKEINDNLKAQNKRQFTLMYSPYQQQRLGSECGVYTLHFLIKRIQGVPFKTIVNHIIRDEKMNKNRQVFFNPLEKYDNRV
jgi:hypothetical protein